MQTPLLPRDEEQRLSSLRALQILDTPPEERFDYITRLAKELFDVPIVVLSLMDEKRQWFKSVVGLSSSETSRDVSFNTHAMLSRELFIIPDARLDVRFADYAIVRGEPHIRFYAGCPLAARDGSVLGVFCIGDRQPRVLSLAEQNILRALGTWIESKLNEVKSSPAPMQSESDKRLQASLEGSDEALLLIGKDQRVLTINHSFSTFFGKSAEEIVGASCQDVAKMFKSLFADSQKIEQLFSETIEDSQHEFTEMLFQSSPQSRMLDLFSVPVQDGNREHLGRIYTFRDSTKRATTLTMLQYQVRHDSLTDLPNSMFFQEQIEEALLSAAPGETSVLFALDFDRFKDVKHTFGRSQGDLLLLLISTRLKQVIPKPGVIARLGADNFAILLPRAGEEKAAMVVQALLKAFEEPFIIAGMPMRIEVCIGVVFAPVHGNNPQTLLRRADIAVDEARRTRTGCVFYDTAFDQQSPSRLALIEALRQAIEDETLQLYYQPKAESQTGKVCSVEALARWYHPTYGFIPPDQFIPLAEQTGLIASLTLCVLKKALRQCQIWQAAGYEIAVAVNLSMWNLRDMTLADTIEEFLQVYDVSASLLCIEVTETALMMDVHQTVEVLKRLCALGMHIAIDDFGSGYSSLAYLKVLPVDELKIDRSFIQNLCTNADDVAITRSIIGLAHQFGLQVVAEGVEDQETWDMLRTFGCDVIQGYYLSRPIPAEQFEQWFQARTSREMLLSLV